MQPRLLNVEHGAQDHLQTSSVNGVMSSRQFFKLIMSQLFKALDHFDSVLEAVCLRSHIINCILLERHIRRFLLQYVENLFIASVAADAMKNRKRKLAFSKVFAEPFICGVLKC